MIYAQIAAPTYDYHVWAYEARQHERMVAKRMARDAEYLKRTARDRRQNSRSI